MKQTIAGEMISIGSVGVLFARTDGADVKEYRASGGTLEVKFTADNPDEISNGLNDLFPGVVRVDEFPYARGTFRAKIGRTFF